MRCNISSQLLLLFCIIIFYGFRPLYSQTSSHDSLLLLINKLRNPSSIRTDSINPFGDKALIWLDALADSSLYYDYYQQLGQYEYRRKKFTRAKSALDQAYNYLDHAKNQPKASCFLYKYLGYTYQKLSINNRAISFMEQALSCYKSNNLPIEQRADIGLRLFRLLYDISKFEEAIEWGEKMPDLLLAANAPVTDYLELNTSMAFNYMYTNQYQKAKYYVDKADYYFHRLEGDTINIDEVRYRGCKVYYILNTQETDYNELLGYMDEWAREFDHTSANRSDRIQFYYLQAGYRAMAFKYEDAMKAADSLVFINSARDKDGRLIVPELYNINNSNYYNLVHAEIALRLYQVNRDTKLLVEGLRSVHDNIHIYDYSRRTLLDIDQRNKSLEFLYETIDVAADLYWESYLEGIISAESFWALSDRYRSSQLKEFNYVNDLNDMYQNMPSALKKGEQQLLDTLYMLQANTDLKQNNRSIYHQKVSKTLKSLYDYQIELGKKYPNYYAQKLEQKFPWIKEVQSYLDSTEVIVEFLIGGSLGENTNCYTFVITCDSFGIVNLASNDFKELIDTYYELLNKNPLTYSNKTEFLQSIKDMDSIGVKLREKVFDPLNIYSYKKWTIIPQDYFNYLPASTLPISNEPTANLKSSSNRLRFIDQFNITYAFSAQWWIEGRSTKPESRAQNQGLAMLPTINREKAQIGLKERKDLIESKQWQIKYPAKRNTLVDELKEIDFDLLYIAAHARYEKDEEKSIVYFEDDNPIPAWQIRKWPLDGKQVVMAACESQLGPQSRAEGMLGLSYYLAAAGAHSITGTLWNINDKTTSEILSPSKYSSVDMRAKNIQQIIKKYRSDASLLFKHPYFWGGFWTFEQQYAMNTNEIYSNLEWSILIGVAIIYILVIIYLIRTKKL